MPYPLRKEWSLACGGLANHRPSVARSRAMARRVDYEPMTLGNMRQHGMTRLDVTCHAADCGHRAMVDVSTFGDDEIVAELGRRFRCSRCGSGNVDARPDWNEYAAFYRARPA